MTPPYAAKLFGNDEVSEQHSEILNLDINLDNMLFGGQNGQP